MPEDYRIGLFDAVWQAVNDRYVQSDFNGVDWEQVRDEYQMYVLQTENAWEVYSLLEEMVGLLEDPSTRFLSSLVLEGQAPVDPGYAGIGTLVDSRTPLLEGSGLRILYVFRGSGAEEAGMRSRDRIISVEGDPCPRIDIIRGPQGTTVSLLVASPGEEPREITVERRRIDTTIYPIAERLEAQPRIGYLRLVTLAGDNTLDATREALAGMLDEGPLDGLVVDLRSTTGGDPAVTADLLGEFLDGPVGAEYTRDDETPLLIEPGDLQDRLARVPVVVLLDGGSEGESEHFGAIMQSQKRAQIVGETTPGRAYGVQDVPFLDGSVLQLSVAGLQLADGLRLERRGVVPDVAVTDDWLTYSQEEDPYILEALKLLPTQSRQGPVPRRPL
jgi:carboxyl-terminal processing protease